MEYIHERRDHSISLEEATEQTKRYCKAIEEGDPKQGLLAGYFPKEAVDVILHQVNCTGIRVYNGIDKNGEETFLLVGVDSEGEDIILGIIKGYPFECPPYCPKGSPLVCDFYK